MQMAEFDRLNSREAAQYVGWTLGSLYTALSRGRGPKPLRAGRKLLFEKPVLDEWLRAETLKYEGRRKRNQ